MNIIHNYSTGHIGEIVKRTDSYYYVVWTDSDTSDGIIKISEGFYNMNNNEHGVHTYYYSNGAKKCETSYLNGIKHGPEICYFRNGNIYYKSNYEKGLKHGETIIIDELKNTICRRLNFAYGELHGQQIVYGHGIPIHIIEFENGLRQGIESKYAGTGQLIARLQWKDNKKTGNYNEYHSNGQLRIVAQFQNDELNGTCIEFDETGKQIGKYIYLNGTKVFH